MTSFSSPLLRSRSEQFVVPLTALDSRSVRKVTRRQDRPGDRSVPFGVLPEQSILFGSEWTSLDVRSDVGPGMGDLPDRSIAELISSVRDGEAIVFRCPTTLRVDREETIFLGWEKRSRREEKNTLDAQPPG